MLKFLVKQRSSTCTEQTDGIAEFAEAAVLIEVGENGAGDAVACVDVVTPTVDDRYGVGLFIAVEVAPEVVMGMGLRRSTSCGETQVKLSKPQFIRSRISVHQSPVCMVTPMR